MATQIFPFLIQETEHYLDLNQEMSFIGQPVVHIRQEQINTEIIQQAQDLHTHILFLLAGRPRNQYNLVLSASGSS
jgi:hypothetical protein